MDTDFIGIQINAAWENVCVLGCNWHGVLIDACIVGECEHGVLIDAI